MDIQNDYFFRSSAWPSCWGCDLPNSAQPDSPKWDNRITIGVHNTYKHNNTFRCYYITHLPWMYIIIDTHDYAANDASAILKGGTGQYPARKRIDDQCLVIQTWRACCSHDGAQQFLTQFHIVVRTTWNEEFILFQHGYNVTYIIWSWRHE